MIFNRLKKRHLLLLISLVLVLTMAVGGTLAYITTQTGAVVNTFTPATTSTGIVEEFNDTVKAYAKISNTGDVPAYIRAQVIVTWKDSQDNVLAETPVLGTDYTLTFPDNTGWFKAGDYYYYSDKVAPNGITGDLLTNGKAYTDRGDYKLSIEVLAQSIQADPAAAVQEAWSAVKVNADGTIGKK